MTVRSRQCVAYAPATLRRAVKEALRTHAGFTALLVCASAAAAPLPPEFDVTELGDNGLALGNFNNFDQRYGGAVRMLGDVNGDDIADFMVGMSNYDGPATLFVSFGTPGDLASRDGFAIRGTPESESNAAAQGSAGPAGDINGDGLNDIIFGGRSDVVDGAYNTGRTYVVLGREAENPTDIDVQDLLPENGGDGSLGFVLDGPAPGLQFGAVAMGVGDVNGDGIDDFAVGSQQAGRDDSADRNGEMFVVFGRQAGFGAALNVAALRPANGGDGSDGFVVYGVSPHDQTRVYDAGTPDSLRDFNNDGIDDLLLASSEPLGADGDRIGHGYVVFGTDQGFPAEIDLAALLPENGGDGTSGTVFRGAGTGTGDAIRSVRWAGDPNNDGIADVIVRSTGTFVVYGASGWPAAQSLDIYLAANGGDGSAGAVLTHPSSPVPNMAGDINDDGIDDLMLGFSQVGAAGAVYVLYTPSDGLPVEFDLTQLAEANGGDGSQGYIISGEPNDIGTGLSFGATLAGAQDFTGDGVDDMLMGDPNWVNYLGRNPGQAYAVFGQAAPAISGTVSGAIARRSVCRNTTDPQTVIINYDAPSIDSAWDCTGQGFMANTGQGVVVVHRANNFGRTLEGTVSGLATGATALCRNDTQSSIVISAIVDERWDCTAAGLPIANGDSVSVILRGERR